MPTPDDVLTFWFGPPDSPTYLQPRAEWFRKDAVFDAAIAARFGTVIDAALAGALSPWAATPAGALALIVVLDQFTRNTGRDTPRAFAGDARALVLARGLVARGDDRALGRFPRAFAYLPFEHAEDMAMQDEAVRLFTALAAQHPDAAHELDYAVRHREVVARFGRFPHRNAILGRESSAEELAFLQQPGSRF